MLISQLPEDIRQLALQRQRECNGQLGCNIHTDYIDFAFSWKHTDEGYKFWEEYASKELRVQTDDQIVI